MQILPIIILGIVFLGVAFIVTKKNAKYLISGFNTLCKKEQDAFDLEGFLTYFKKFHVFLGVTVLIVGLLLSLFVNKSYSTYFLIFYPLFAYLYFGFKTRKFQTGRSRMNFYALIIVLGIAIVGMGFSLFWSNSDNSITISEHELIISGSYGFKLPVENIEKIALIDSLPKIIKRTNGISVGNTNKGRFKAADGRTIRLFLNNDETPRIMILAKGREIYYASKNKDNSRIYQELTAALNAVK